MKLEFYIFTETLFTILFALLVWKTPARPQTLTAQIQIRFNAIADNTAGCCLYNKSINNHAFFPQKSAWFFYALGLYGSSA